MTVVRLHTSVPSISLEVSQAKHPWDAMQLLCTERVSENKIPFFAEFKQRMNHIIISVPALRQRLEPDLEVHSVREVTSLAVASVRPKCHGIRDAVVL